MVQTVVAMSARDARGNDDPIPHRHSPVGHKAMAGRESRDSPDDFMTENGPIVSRNSLLDQVAIRPADTNGFHVDCGKLFRYFSFRELGTSGIEFNDTGFDFCSLKYTH